jgi:hypothetical protein
MSHIPEQDAVPAPTPTRRGRPVGTCPDCGRHRVLYGEPGRCRECRCGRYRGLSLGEKYDLDSARTQLLRRAGRLALALAARGPDADVRGTAEWREVERLAGELARLRAGKGVRGG